MIGTTELLLIAALVLLLFGGKKLPEMMRGMGKGVKSFKEGMNEPLEQPEEHQNANEGAPTNPDEALPKNAENAEQQK